MSSAMASSQKRSMELARKNRMEMWALYSDLGFYLILEPRDSIVLGEKGTVMLKPVNGEIMVAEVGAHQSGKR